MVGSLDGCRYTGISLSSTVGNGISQSLSSKVDDRP